MQRVTTFLLLLVLSKLLLAQPLGGERVDFQSANVDATKVVLRGMLFKPRGTPRGGVVLVHGSSGWNDPREGHYGRALSAAGYLVLAVDSFGARGVTSTAEDQARLSTLQMTMDAFAARRYLLELGIDSKRTAIMGASKGGQVALFAADRTFLPAETDRFSLAIPFYPGCNNRPLEPKPTASMFMILGEKDDYTGVKPCQDIANSFASAGGSVQVKIYPNSTHGFDGDPQNVRMFRLPTVENFIDCVADVDSEGQLIYAGKKFASGDLSVVAEMRKSCVKKGATMWTNPTQKQQVTEDVVSFLNAAFPQ
ncbi:MAG: dienelactone hydrolase family protein [Anaerolineae bacterium]|nr:dienelactone hydrolase family protein [Gemmatimonadaceae bacterium]